MPTAFARLLRSERSQCPVKTRITVVATAGALGHTSVTITERYYAKWNKAQQDILDGDLASAS
jgi:hypothetical protein